MCCKSIKSEFIKNKIKRMSYSNSKQRRYIDDLIDLENYILNGVHSTGGGYHYNSLQKRYPKEWAEIYKELDPVGFRKVMEIEAQFKEENKRMMEEGAKREREWEKYRKRRWIALGGKP